MAAKKKLLIFSPGIFVWLNWKARNDAAATRALFHSEVQKVWHVLWKGHLGLKLVWGTVCFPMQTTSGAVSRRKLLWWMWLSKQTARWLTQCGWVGSKNRAKGKVWFNLGKISCPVQQWNLVDVEAAKQNRIEKQFHRGALSLLECCCFHVEQALFWGLFS